ncbi:MAG: hypothetical protein E5Y16_02335 [Mesorhizobium sp.]|nr:MAG: hypothetical protein EOS08_10415 [Mesorhizobium sp.]TJV46732.1 MAG: hypothetical protein E5Y16_02335 [Mesorhizobium sp.]
MPIFSQPANGDLLRFRSGSRALLRCRTFDRGGTAPPLCPAGHLPHKEGDWPSSLISPTTNLARLCASSSAKRDAVREAANLPPSGGDAEFWQKRAGQRGARRIATERFYSEPQHYGRKLAGMRSRVGLCQSPALEIGCSLVGQRPPTGLFRLIQRTKFSMQRLRASSYRRSATASGTTTSLPTKSLAMKSAWARWKSESL